MNQFAKPGLAEEKLPPVSSADNGKVLGVNNGVWEKVAASGGTTVVANPTIAGTEADLTGLQVGDTKYKIPEGGGGGGVLVVTVTWDESENGTCDKTAAEMWAAFPNICFKVIDDGVYYEACVRAQQVDGTYVFVNTSGAYFHADTASNYPKYTDLN